MVYFFLLAPLEETLRGTLALSGMTRRIIVRATATARLHVGVCLVLILGGMAMESTAFVGQVMAASACMYMLPAVVCGGKSNA